MKIIKNILKMSLLSLCMYTINAYENSFFNNTDTPIGIAIQYTGNDNIVEPLYKKLVKPNSLVSFIPGKKEGLEPNKKQIPAIKWGFCLDKIYFVENPTEKQKVNNFSKATWRNIPITWIEEKSLTKKREIRLHSTDPKKPETMVTVKKASPTLEKSLCRDRHFDITRNEHGKIIIMTSLRD